MSGVKPGAIALGVIGAGVGTLIEPGGGTIQGFAIGFSVGNALFPPTIDDKVKPTHQLPTVQSSEGAIVPLVRGRRRIKAANLKYFGFDKRQHGDHARTGSKGGNRSADTTAGEQIYYPVHFDIALGPGKLWGVLSTNGADWQQTNLDNDGEALQISSPPSDANSLNTYKAFNYTPGSQAPGRGVFSAYSGKFYIGRNVNAMIPLIFDWEGFPCQEVEDEAGQAVAIGQYIDNPFSDLFGGYKLGDNAIVRPDETQRKDYTFAPGNTNVNLAVSRQQYIDGGATGPVLQLNGLRTTGPGAPAYDGAAARAFSIKPLGFRVTPGQIPGDATTPKLTSADGSITYARGRDWDFWPDATSGESGLVVLYKPPGTIYGVPGTHAPASTLPNDPGVNGTQFRFVASYCDVEQYRGCNPAAFYYEILANKQWGRRIPQTLINVASFRAAFIRFRDEYLAINFKQEITADSARSIIRKLHGWTNSFFRKDDQGRVDICPIRTDQFYTTFTADESEAKDVECATGCWISTDNTFTASFPGTDYNEKRHVVPGRNTANLSIVGFQKPHTFDFDGFTDITLANARMWQLLKFYSYPVTVASFTTSNRLHRCRKGDVILLTSSRWGLDNVPIRVTDVTYPKLGSARMTFKGYLDIEQLYSKRVPTVPSNEGTNRPSTPTDPLDITAIAQYWPSHVSFVDADPLASPAGSFKTLVAVARGAGSDIASQVFLGRYFTQFDFTNFGGNVDRMHQGTTLVTFFGYRFTLMKPIAANDWTYALPVGAHLPVFPISDDVGNKSIILRIDGFETYNAARDVYLPQDFARQSQTDAEPYGPATGANGSGYNTAWETSAWVMWVGGREAVRWKKVEKLSDTDAIAGGLPTTFVDGNGKTHFRGYYRFTEMMRGANKEQLLAWPTGTSVWIFPVTEPFRGAVSYDQWANRALSVRPAEFADASSANIGQYRFRIKSFAQEISASGAVSSESTEAKRYFGTEDFSQSGALDRTNPATALYPNDSDATCLVAPMCASIAIRTSDWPTTTIAGLQQFYASNSGASRYLFGKAGFPSGADFGVANANPAMTDWLVQFMPCSDKEGIGDALAYDSVTSAFPGFPDGTPLPAPSNPTDWPWIGVAPGQPASTTRPAGTDPGANAFATDQKFVGQVYRLRVIRWDTKAVLLTVEVTVGSGYRINGGSFVAATVSGGWKRWPSFIVDGALANLDPYRGDYFEVSRLGSNGAWSRATVAVKACSYSQGASTFGGYNNVSLLDQHTVTTLRP